MTPRRIAGTVGALLIPAVAAFGLYVWNAAFRLPPVHPLPLPAALVSLETPEGQRLLAQAEAFTADYAGLSAHFERQSRGAFCGVASSVDVLNALTPGATPVTQASFFTRDASRVRSRLAVTLGGMTLDDLGGLLRAHGATVEVHHAAEESLEAFRALAKANLSTPGDALLVNYGRAALEQAGPGHISPVAAYNAEEDRILVLDVAADKYPAVWVSTGALWRAMRTIDPASGQSRGFVVVRRPAPPQVSWLTRAARAGGVAAPASTTPRPARTARR